MLGDLFVAVGAFMAQARPTFGPTLIRQTGPGMMDDAVTAVVPSVTHPWLTLGSPFAHPHRSRQAFKITMAHSGQIGKQ